MNLKDIKELLNKTGGNRKSVGRGWTIEQFYLQFKIQNECCAICGTHQSQLDNLMVIDHDHKTGEDRGLLCRGCNIKLGYYETQKQLDFKKYLKTAPQRMKRINAFKELEGLEDISDKKEVVKFLRERIKELEKYS